MDRKHFWNPFDPFRSGREICEFFAGRPSERFGNFRPVGSPVCPAGGGIPVREISVPTFRILQYAGSHLPQISNAGDRTSFLNALPQCWKQKRKKNDKNRYNNKKLYKSKKSLFPSFRHLFFFPFIRFCSGHWQNLPPFPVSCNGLFHGEIQVPELNFSRRILQTEADDACFCIRRN